MITTASMTPFQLARLVRDVLGVRPNANGEKVVKANITEGYCVVQIQKTGSERKGRREITVTHTIVKVWEKTPKGWALIQSVSSEGEEQTVLAFDCPTAQDVAERRAHETLGRPFDRDGYRRPIPQGV